MKQKAVTQLVILAFLFTLLVIMLSAVVLSARTITVDDSGGADHTKIQDAVDAAEDGDTVSVNAGTYNEKVVVSKSIDLIGESNSTVIIEGDGEGDVVGIRKPWVNMSGFSVRGSGTIYSDAGIKVRASHCSIFSNNCSFNGANGVRIEEPGHHSAVHNNSFYANQGIAIKLYEVHHVSVNRNSCQNNGHSGISADKSHNNSFARNSCSGGSMGIYASYGGDNIIQENRCYDNLSLPRRGA